MMFVGCSSELEKGNQLFEEGKYQEALVMYGKIQSTDYEVYHEAQKKIGEVNVALGNQFFEKGKYEEALKMYEKIWSPHKENLEVYDKFGGDVCFILGEKLFEEGKFEAALAMYRKVGFGNGNYDDVQKKMEKLYRKQFLDELNSVLNKKFVGLGARGSIISTEFSINLPSERQSLKIPEIIIGKFFIKFRNSSGGYIYGSPDDYLNQFRIDDVDQIFSRFKLLKTIYPLTVKTLEYDNYYEKTILDSRTLKGGSFGDLKSDY